ncbi:Elongation of very long chain fatty acids protein [Operophtera brumata]|uniref:Elongation of very long chain fatty acids protein n=1 Tax=Operophtera brumata TaxID=104452 RepID=A0A0L7KZE2_OPEBR|nr:Elongation of very long chain fatty acids protein [Operophtera brumata]
MSVILNGIWENFNFVFYQLNDERTRDVWPSFTTLVTILCTYLYFVKKVGPAWMNDKKPYELKNTILVYNLIQIIISAYLFYEAFFNVWFKEYNWTCQPVDYSDSPTVTKTINLVWAYMMLKLVDLLDTVFFVLRKKDPGHATLLGVINCFVHTIMYTYYLIAGLGPQYQKYLWWKKHVTTLQLWINVALSISALHFVYMFGKFYYVNYIKNKSGTKKHN